MSDFQGTNVTVHQQATQSRQLVILQPGITAQLTITHSLAGIVALVVTLFLQARLIPNWLIIMLTVISAASIGLVLTLNIQRGLQLAEAGLARLSQGQPLAGLPTARLWPLTKLLLYINRFGAREREYGERRGQLLQQVGETAAQEERNRLARELHDSIKQQIFSISVSAAAAQARWEHDPDGAKSALGDVRRSAHEAQVEMRALLQQLRPAPLETLGLIQALRDQCEALEYRSGAKVTAELGELPSNEMFPLGAQESLFRIAQEAFANIARHARASHVQASLTHNTISNEVTFDLVDDGQGFEMSAAHIGMGLTNIRERVQSLGGSLDVHSAPGNGTRLNVHIPLVKIESNLEQEEDMSTGVCFRDWRNQWGLMCGIFMSLIVFSLIAVRARDLVEQVGQPGWLLRLLIIAIASGLTLAGFIQVNRKVTETILSHGNESKDTLKWRIASHQGYLAACLFGLWILPGTPLYWPEWGLMARILPLVIGGLFAILSYLELRHVLRLYERYYAYFSLNQLQREIDQYRRQLTWVPALSVTFIISLISGSLHFPFERAGDWMNTLGVVATIVLWLTIKLRVRYLTRWQAALLQSETGR